MKNKTLLNISYKFLNRFITVDELIEQLSNMDNSKLKDESKKKLNSLIKGIKKLAKSLPNEEDEFISKEKDKIKNIITNVESIPQNDENKDRLNKVINNLKNEYNKEKDSFKRWYTIAKYISDNDYFNTCFESLSKYELLEFIGQNISAPNPPNLSQEEFDELVKVGIKKDERELLWRLAFNYENKKIDFNKIVDYYIKKKDGYYLGELISAVGKQLDINKIIDDINDKDLIIDLISRKSAISEFINDEQFNRLNSKIEQ